MSDDLWTDFLWHLFLLGLAVSVATWGIGTLLKSVELIKRDLGRKRRG